MKTIKNLYALLVMIGLGYASISFGEGKEETDRLLSPSEVPEDQYDEYRNAREQIIQHAVQHEGIFKGSKEFNKHDLITALQNNNKNFSNTQGTTLRAANSLTVTEPGEDAVAAKKSETTLDKSLEQFKLKKSPQRDTWFKSKSQAITESFMDQFDKMTNKQIQDHLDMLVKELNSFGRSKQTRLENIMKILNERPGSLAAEMLRHKINSANILPGKEIRIGENGQYQLVTSSASVVNPYTLDTDQLNSDV